MKHSAGSSSTHFAWKRWIVRVLAGLAIVLGLAVASAPWTVPAYLRHAIPQWIGQALGRHADVGTITFNPIRLHLRIDDLRIAQAGGRGSALALSRLDARLAWSTLWTGVPRLDTLGITRPTLRVTRDPSGRLDIDDILTRLSRAPKRPGAPPPRFVLRDLGVENGAIVLDDRATGVATTLNGLTLRLPLLSAGDAQGGVIHATASARLDGAPVTVRADGPVLGSRSALRVSVGVTDLPLAGMAAYAPSTLALRLAAAKASANVVLSITPSTPQDLDASGDVVLRQAELQGRDGTALGGWSALAVRIAHLRPFARVVDIASVQVDGLHAKLRRIGGGIAGLQIASASASASASRPRSTTPSPTPPWTVHVEAMTLRASTLGWQDATLPGAPTWTVTAPLLRAGPLRWPQTEPVPFDARIEGPQGLKISAAGSAGRAGVQARVTMAHFDPRVAHPYLDASGLPTPSGTIGLDATIRLAAGAPIVDVHHARWDDFSVGANASSPLRAASIALDETRVDVASRTVAVGDLTISRPVASLARDSAGSWSWEQLLPASRGAGTHPKSAQEGSAWRIDLAQAHVEGGQAYLADTRPARPVVLAVTGLNATVRGAKWPQAGPARLVLDASVSDQLQPATDAGAAPPGQGQLHFDGTVQAQPLRILGTVGAQDLPAQLAEHYIPPRINAQVLRALAGAKGQVDFSLAPAGPTLRFQGDASIRRFLAYSLAPREPLLGWGALQLDGMKFAMSPGAPSPFSLDIGKVAVHDFYARVLLDEHAKLNLTSVFAQRGSAAAPATKPPQGPAPRITIGGIVLDNGRVSYTDHFVRPNYATDLTAVSGTIGAVASDRVAAATVDLHAVAQGSASVSLQGDANPLHSPPVLDLHGIMNDLQLAPLSPYSGRYAGYNIQRGLLSMNVHYKVTPTGVLNADNRLTLKQLTFGDPVASPDATKLPVLLAVDLLKDQDGNINVDIPVSGSLNDPQFSLGSLISDAIGHVLLRAITAPFSLLGHLFGGGGAPPHVDHIAFAPGSAALAAADTAKLDAVARIMQAKPNLILTITGEASPTVEHDAYAGAVVERRMVALWKQSLPRAERLASTSAKSVPDADRARVLAALYHATPLPGKARNLLGMETTPPTATMRAMLLADVPAGEDRMLALAMRRAETLRDALAQRGVPPARQFIGAPRLESSPAAGWTPEAVLSLSLP